jgi:GR25 family glycosyltransferase involved in LPS biosynthesis
MDKIDIIYYINLAHRTDRDQSIKGQLLNHAHIDADKIHRIDAIHEPQLGALGCSLSHIKAVEEFLKTPDSVRTCLILEDDFVFNMPIEDVNKLLNEFWKVMGDDYDVLMLGCNIRSVSKTEYPFFYKINGAQTLSGYCFNKKYASILLENFKEGNRLLESAGKAVHEYCVDQYITSLQERHRWYVIYPIIGRQGPSYSDIEGKFVDYGC